MGTRGNPCFVFGLGLNPTANFHGDVIMVQAADWSNDSCQKS